MIRRAVTSGFRAVEGMVELIDLEARGVQDAAKLVRAVPRVPWRVALFARDVVVVLAQMPSQEASSWRAFRERFTALHGMRARSS